jgi:hypothetical protein
LAVVARFRDLAGAEVASATLEAAGILNSLADTSYVGLVWTNSTAVKWIRLSVRDADLPEALELLAATADADWPADLEEAEAEACPACGSADLVLESGPRKTIALMLFTYVPLWFWRSRVTCRGCGTSRLVPLRFRPDLVMAWLVVALGVGIASAITSLVLGFVAYGRRSW